MLYGFQGIQNIIQGELSTPLPSFLQSTIRFFNWSSLEYRKITLSNRMKENPSITPIFVGAMLNFARDWTLGRFSPINILLYAKCVENLLKDYRQLSEANTTFWNLCFDTYPAYHPCFQPDLLSKTKRFVHRIIEISLCAARILWQAFKIGIHLTDTSLLFQGDRETTSLACTELALDLQDYFTKIQDEEKLQQEVGEKSEIIDRIAYWLHLSQDSQSIKNYLKENEGKREKQEVGYLQGIFEDMVLAGNQTFKDFTDPGPLKFDFSDPRGGIPELPPAQFPPWGGEPIQK